MLEIGSKVTINGHYLKAVGSNDFIECYISQGYGELLYYNNLTKTCRVSVKGQENIFDVIYVYPMIEKEEIYKLTADNRIELFLEFMEKRG